MVLSHGLIEAFRPCALCNWNTRFTVVLDHGLMKPGSVELQITPLPASRGDIQRPTLSAAERRGLMKPGQSACSIPIRPGLSAVERRVSLKQPRCACLHRLLSQVARGEAPRPH